VNTETVERSARGVGGRLHGRGGLVIPLVMALVSTYVVIGIAMMEVPPDTTFPGPKFFPTILAVAGYVLAALLTLHYLRHPDEKADQTEYRTYSDWTAFAWIVGGIAVFILLLDLLGWIVAGGLLFWCVTRAFGSSRPAFDVSVAFTVSSAIYLIFGVALGLPLPSGILGGL
jgi:putative tricarboxylic transport membrane protein